MRSLIALAIGWLLIEGQPQPQADHFLLAWPEWVGRQLILFAWIAGAGFALAASLGRSSAGSWQSLAMVSLGAWLPAGLLTMPFFGLGPGWAAGILWALGLAALRYNRNAESIERAPSEFPNEGLGAAIPKAPAPRWTFGFLFAGFAIGVTLLSLARMHWRLGESEGADLSIAIPTFLLLAAIGAFAFGRPIKTNVRDKGAAFALLAFGGGSFIALRSAETLGTHRGLRTMVRRFGSDLSLVGTHFYSMLITVSMLILPAFFAGMLFCCTRTIRERIALFVGLGVAFALYPWLLEAAWMPAFKTSATLGLLSLGWSLLGIAAGLTFWFAGKKVIAPIAAGALLALSFLYPFELIEFGKPWSRTLKLVQWTADYPEGQLSIYSEGPDSFSARLDQRQVSPAMEGQRLDQRILLVSMGLLPTNKRGKARILLSGLLTPERERNLLSLGATTVDRVAPYWRLGKTAENSLGHGGHDHSHDDAHSAHLHGAWVSPKQALQQVQEGQYDLIIVPPEALGYAAKDLAGTNTIQAAWRSGDANLAHWDNQQGAWLLCSDGLERFAGATLTGLEADWIAPNGGLRIEPGEPTSNIRRTVWIAARDWERPILARKALFSRLGGAVGEGPQARLFDALNDLQEIQKHSSPYETEARQMELEGDLSTGVAQALTGLEPNGFYAELAGGLTRILIGKRDIAGVLEVAPGLSEHFGKPFELERSLARAELESLNPSAAAARLKALDARFPNEEGLIREYAAALDQTSLNRDAVAAWSQLLALHPDDFEVEKAWVLALVRAGDDRAEEALASIRTRHPEDITLKTVSQSGPPTVPDALYTPSEGLEHDHDDHE